MSKTLYLSEISGRFIKYEDNPVTSHTPQLLASDCFLSKKEIQRLALNLQKQYFCNLKRGWIFRMVPAK